MRFAQTSRGIVRIGPDGARRLDHPRSLEDLILDGGLAELADLPPGEEIDWNQATVAPPVRRPGKVFIIGLNYRDHAAETGSPLPDRPSFHLVPGSAVTADRAVVPLPRVAPAQVDYEGELAVVIGHAGREIPEAAAWDHVAGATVANDLSARDVQGGTNPALPMAHPALAKGFDGFKPLGPALLTTDELRAHDGLALTTEVNGAVRQSSSTAQLIFPRTPARRLSQLLPDPGRRRR